MSKNLTPSRQDAGQLWKRVFQTEHDALRVIQATDIETTFSLSHKEDSVFTKCSSEVLPTNESTNCNHLKRIMAYQDCEVTLTASQDVTFSFFLKAGDIKEICALSLKSTGVLVGQ